MRKYFYKSSSAELYEGTQGIAPQTFKDFEWAVFVGDVAGNDADLPKDSSFSLAQFLNKLGRVAGNIVIIEQLGQDIYLHQATGLSRIFAHQSSDFLQHSPQNYLWNVLHGKYPALKNSSSSYLTDAQGKLHEGNEAVANFLLQEKQGIFHVNGIDVDTRTDLFQLLRSHDYPLEKEIYFVGGVFQHRLIQDILQDKGHFLSEKTLFDKLIKWWELWLQIEKDGKFCESLPELLQQVVNHEPNRIDEIRRDAEQAKCKGFDALLVKYEEDKKKLLSLVKELILQNKLTLQLPEIQAQAEKIHYQKGVLAVKLEETEVLITEIKGTIYADEKEKEEEWRRKAQSENVLFTEKEVVEIINKFRESKKEMKHRISVNFSAFSWQEKWACLIKPLASMNLNVYLQSVQLNKITSIYTIPQKYLEKWINSAYLTHQKKWRLFSFLGASSLITLLICCYFLLKTTPIPIRGEQEAAKNRVLDSIEKRFTHKSCEKDKQFLVEKYQKQIETAKDSPALAILLADCRAYMKGIKCADCENNEEMQTQKERMIRKIDSVMNLITSNPRYNIPMTSEEANLKYSFKGKLMETKDCDSLQKIMSKAADYIKTMRFHD